MLAFLRNVVRLRSRGAYTRLEPDDGKPSSPVLRGGSGSNAAPYPTLEWKDIHERAPSRRAILEMLARSSASGLPLRFLWVPLPRNAFPSKTIELASIVSLTTHFRTLLR